MKLVESYVLRHDQTSVIAVIYSANGELIVGGGGFINEPGRIVAWSAATHIQIASCISDRPTVSSLACSPDETVLASSCQTANTIELGDLDSWSCKGTLALVSPPFRRGPSDLLQTDTHVASMAFSPDGRHLAAGCWDMTVKVWDLQAPQPARELADHRNNVDFVTFGVSEKVLISGTYQRLFAWDVPNATVSRRIPLDSAELWKHVAIEPAGIASVSRKGKIRLWNVNDWSYCDFAIPLRRPVWSLAYSRFSDLLAIGLQNGEIHFWSVAHKRAVGTWKRDTDPISRLAFSPTWPRIAVVSDKVAEYEYEL